MRNSSFVACLFAIVLAAPSQAQEGKATRPPNVVIILADDLGYADIGVHGCKDVPTPHIDSIAKNGVRCSNGYVTGFVCAPTRAGLMTGRYQQRFGFMGNGNSLPTSEETLADRLKSAGYATALIGKWHLGDPGPKNHGFDEFVGFLNGESRYGRGDDYLTAKFSREAVAFIEGNQAKPFFLYLAYNAVHWPLEAPQAYLDRFAAIDDTRRRTYAAMLAALDDGIGTVLAKLRAANLDQDTLVFFLSDNGGPTAAGKVNGSRNDPLSGGKATLAEGGIRVPFLMQWRGRLPAGKVYEQPVISLDIFPTALAAAGAKLPGDRDMDGVNLLPYFTGHNDKPPHAALYWRAGTNSAIRQGNWKLVNGKLFDLATDIAEKTNLAAQKPEVVKELRAASAQWNSEIAKKR